MYLGNESMDLKLSLLDSAQCFCWRPVDAGYAAVLQGRLAYLYRQSDGLHAQGDWDRDALRRYLDLDRDYARLADRYCELEAARRAIALYPGLRVLRQDPWEALVAFILSANNNVQRIRNLAAAISRELGPRFDFRGEAIYGLPAPDRMAQCDEAQLRALGVGYRAPYLIETARRVAEGFPLWELQNWPYADAHAALVQLPGVGDKVADCVLLFGCGHTSAFPVDVWVERLLKSWLKLEAKSRKEMQRKARAILGEEAGLLQQFLFHAARMGDIELE